MSQQLSVAAEQHHCAAVSGNRCTQGAEVSAFAIATGNQYQLAVDISTQAFDGGERRTDVGGLGIVIPAHTVALT
ncbi:hypothetical protein D3C75_1327800 [compost metagenome]